MPIGNTSADTPIFDRWRRCSAWARDLRRSRLRVLRRVPRRLRRRLHRLKRRHRQRRWRLDPGRSFPERVGSDGEAGGHFTDPSSNVIADRPATASPAMTAKEAKRSRLMLSMAAEQCEPTDRGQREATCDSENRHQRGTGAVVALTLDSGVDRCRDDLAGRVGLGREHCAARRRRLRGRRLRRRGRLGRGRCRVGGVVVGVPSPSSLVRSCGGRGRDRFGAGRGGRDRGGRRGRSSVRRGRLRRRGLGGGRGRGPWRSVGAVSVGSWSRWVERWSGPFRWW